MCEWVVYVLVLVASEMSLKEMECTSVSPTPCLPIETRRSFCRVCACTILSSVEMHARVLFFLSLKCVHVCHSFYH